MRKFICLLIVFMLFCSPALAISGLTDFTTVDMEGNIVTQDIFADYDLTIVNVWATWCVYCVEEMPSLSKLKTMLPENVNFITLCQDAHVETDLAREILESSGANFQTLLLTQDIYEQFFHQIEAFPSTFFLDSKGMSVSAPIVGVPSREAPAEAYYALTTLILKKMGLDK